jgi:hypothetical protein
MNGLRGLVVIGIPQNNEPEDDIQFERSFRLKPTLYKSLITIGMSILPGMSKGAAID